MRPSSTTQRTLISIVAPVFNEEASIEEFAARTLDTLGSLGEEYAYELIFVDDGSRDGSLEILRRLTTEVAEIRVIELRRNYGQTAALQAGLDAARGDILITMDADLQHFPEEIPDFLKKLDEGYDVVCGWRHKRQEGVIRRWPSRIANLLIKAITGLKIHDFGTTFRAYRVEIVHDIRLLGEFHRYIPALAQNVGARIAEIPIRNIERQAGQSKYGIGRTFGVMLDLIVLSFLVRYMDRPMRAFGKLAAFAFSAASTITVALVVYAYAARVHAVREHSGWFLMAIMLFIASVQITLTGILAEILVRVHYGQQDKRVYRVRHEWTGEAAAETQ